MRAAALLEQRTGGTAACPLAYGPNDEGLCEWDGRPVPHPLARWCSEKCMVAWDDAHVWPRARDAALRRAARRCSECGRGRSDGVRVEVHHDPPVDRDSGGYDPGCQHHADHLVVLCREHHQRRHRWLRARPGEQLALFVSPATAGPRRRRRGRPRLVPARAA